VLSKHQYIDNKPSQTIIIDNTLALSTYAEKPVCIAGENYYQFVRIGTAHINKQTKSVIILYIKIRRYQVNNYALRGLESILLAWRGIVESVHQLTRYHRRVLR